MNAGFGKRPALLVIDVTYASVGQEGWDSVRVIRKLIVAARIIGIPVIYTTGVRQADGIAAGIEPGPRDIVVLKQKSAGFFGTDMAPYLTLLGCDSVIVTGAATSGSVRATVLDAFCLDYRIAVVGDGCFDRSEASHALDLCDMNARYADVVTGKDVLGYFATLPAGMFELPSGNVAPLAKAAGM